MQGATLDRRQEPLFQVKVEGYDLGEVDPP